MSRPTSRICRSRTFTGTMSGMRTCSRRPPGWCESSSATSCFPIRPSPRTEPANYSALKNSTAVIVTKDEHDVFGDGTVILKSAPGHSPDHQVLFVKLAKTGPIVLSGDLYHYPEERKLQQDPDHGIQRRADGRVESRRRGLPEENRRPALDPARLHCQRQDQEGARVLRLDIRRRFQERDREQTSINRPPAVRPGAPPRPTLNPRPRPGLPTRTTARHFRRKSDTFP